MEEIISVVIPVYNAEALLPVCLDSLLRQTYERLEIVLVDDGSRDGSPALCDEYARKDPRIKVVHQENQGVSAARNAGIRNATGKYISFIDADDYVEADYFRRLHQGMVEHGADMVCCDYVEVLKGDSVAEYAPKVESSRLVADSKEVFASMAEQRESYWSCVWGKLIKTELTKDVAFSSTLKYGEDQVYMYDLLLKEPVIYLDTYKGYYYIRNESSATVRVGMHHLKRRLDEMRMQEYRLAKLPEYARECTAAFMSLFADSIQRVIIALAITGTKEEKKEHRKALCAQIKKVPLKTFSPKGRIHALLYLLCPGIYDLLMRGR